METAWHTLALYLGSILLVLMENLKMQIECENKALWLQVLRRGMRWM